MSEEREEIRWQFQMMIENINSEIERIEWTMRLTDEDAERSFERFEKLRNGFLASIGFIITTLVTLIASDKLGESYIQSAGVAGLVGWIAYLYAWFFLRRERKQHLELMFSYLDTIGKNLRPLVGMTTTLALNESITKNELDLIRKYLVSYVQAAEYELISKILDELEIDHDKYRKYYEQSVSNIDNFKKYDFSLGTTIIEKFIKEFERNKSK